MKKINNSTITYIKNGIETTIILTPYNLKKISKILFKKSWKYELYLRENIEFVKFTNVNFCFRNFHTLSDTLIIFDNCNFDSNIKIENVSNKTYGGNVEFINPKALSSGQFQITAIFLNDISLVFEESPTYQPKIFGTSNNLSLKGNIDYGTIEIESKKIYLNNVDGIIDMYLDSKNSIECSNCNLKIKEVSGSDFIFTPNLILNNTTIFKEKYNNMPPYKLKLEIDKISGKNFTLIIQGEIKIGNNSYITKKGEDYAIITDKILNDKKHQSITSLISDLKTIKNIVVEYKEKETKKQQKKYSDQIKKYKEEIAKTKEKSHKKIKKLTKKIDNTPISKIVKKDDK